MKKKTVPENSQFLVQNIYEEGELVPEATVKKYLTVRSEGQRGVKRLLDHYNLDMIISVGYRVKSHMAIHGIGCPRPGGHDELADNPTK